jgi:hypothetical protein
MSYRVTRSAEGRPSITLNGEPPYCRGLAAAPLAREPELGSGLWLVMAFAAWSVSEIGAIQSALDAVKRFGGKVNLGLRPFDNLEEQGTWCPELMKDGNSPLWVLLRDGDVCMKRQGLLRADALVDAIEGACPE